MWRMTGKTCIRRLKHNARRNRWAEWTMPIAVIVTDFTKGVDRINHSLQVRELGRCDIQGRINGWITSFPHNLNLAHRRGGHRWSWVSTQTILWSTVKSGIAQGLVLVHDSLYHGWVFSGYSRISGFRYLSESNKKCFLDAFWVWIVTFQDSNFNLVSPMLNAYIPVVTLRYSEKDQWLDHKLPSQPESSTQK